MRRRAILAVSIVVLLAASPARASDDDPEALVREGLALRREGKDAEALDVFRRAYAARATPRGQAQIALAEQALGRWLAAEADLARALDAVHDPWIGANRALLESSLASIRGRLGWILVTADVARAELWVNDARAGTLPMSGPMRIEAGSAVVEVRAPGYASSRRVVDVEPGSRALEAVHMVALVAPPSANGAVREAGMPPTVPVPRRIAPADRRLRATAYVVGAAGVVGLAAGSYYGIRTFQAKSDRDAQCARGCSALGVAYDGEARSLASRSTAWIAGGASALVAGVVLFWVARPRTVSGDAGGIGVVPSVGPERAALEIRGSW